MKLKLRDLFLLFIFYLLSSLLGLVVYLYLPFESPLIKIFISLMCASLLLYIISLIIKWYSLIGLMWGLFPIISSIVFILGVKNYSTYAVIFTILACLQGLRYLILYIYRFVSFRCEDFRIEALKAKKLKHLFIFLIYLILPLILFTAMLPGFYFVNSVTRGADFAPSIMTGVALALMLFSTVMEAVADFQLVAFKNIPANQGLVYDRGLWKNSRHPNYFFEVLYWFSVFLVSFSMPKLIYILVFCPLGIFIIMEFFSVRLMDSKELSTKPAYQEYYDKTNPMLPIFRPKEK